jgi:hypothetical protein
MKKNVPQYSDRLNGLIAMCLVAVLLILMLTYAAPRHPVSSAETDFTDKTAHGLTLMPASCASYVAYYHGVLTGTADGGGYITSTAAGEYGAYAPSLGTYICVSNTSGQQYFIPTHTQNEYNYFRSYPPPGVSAW